MFSECNISLIFHENTQEDKLKRMRYGEIAEQKREIHALIRDTIKAEMVDGYKSKSVELWLFPERLI